jgi:hypothetical protein
MGSDLRSITTDGFPVAGPRPLTSASSQYFLSKSGRNAS